MAYQISDEKLRALDRAAKLTFGDIREYAKFHFKDEWGRPYIMAEYQVAAAHIILERYVDLLENSIKRIWNIDDFKYHIDYDLIRKWTNDGGTDDLGRGHYDPTVKDFFIIWHRQLGKTTTMVIVCTYLLDVIPGFEIGVFYPTGVQSVRVALKRIRALLKANIRLRNKIQQPNTIGSADKLEFLNGSYMESMSIHPESVVEGRTLHLGWVDEISDVHGDRIRGVVKPMLNTRDGWVVQTGKYKQSTEDNFVYEYIDGNSKDSCSSIIIPMNDKIQQYVPETFRQNYINSIEQVKREYREGIMDDETMYSNYLLRLSGSDNILMNDSAFMELSTFKEDSYSFLDVEYFVKHKEAVKNGTLKVPTLKDLGLPPNVNIYAGMDIAKTSDRAVIVFGIGEKDKLVIHKKFLGGYQFKGSSTYDPYLEILQFILEYVVPVYALEIDYTSEKSFTDIGIETILKNLKNNPRSLTRNLIVVRYDMKLSAKHTAAVDSLQHSIRRRHWSLPDFTDDYIHSECYRLSKLQWTHTRVENRRDGAAKVINSTDKRRFKDDWSDALFYLNDVIDNHLSMIRSGATKGVASGLVLPDKSSNPFFSEEEGMKTFFNYETEVDPLEKVYLERYKKFIQGGM